MKKVILFLALSTIMFCETVKVDIEYMMSKHPKFESIKTDLEKEKTRLQGIIDVKQNELNLEKATLDTKGNTVTEEEVTNFYKKEQELQNLYTQAQNTLLTFKNEKMQSLFNEIISVLEILQKNQKYDAVIEGSSIYLGKDSIKDVSEEAIKLFKGAEKISLF